jgi:hypothetical protein
MIMHDNSVTVTQCHHHHQNKILPLLYDALFKLWTVLSATLSPGGLERGKVCLYDNTSDFHRQKSGLCRIPKRKTKSTTNLKGGIRLFLAGKSEFSWLICDDSHGKIFCQPCRAVYVPLAVRSVPERFKHYAKGPFVVECENLRHDALTTHEKSDQNKILPLLYDALFKLWTVLSATLSPGGLPLYF